MTMRGGSCDVLVIGAGPAGMAATVVLAEAGLDVVVADEGSAPGGQVYRTILSQTPRLNDLLGREYRDGADLARRFVATPARILPRTAAFLLEPQPDGGVLAGLADASAGSAQLVRAKTVLIATGALERPFPISGWTLPGVMTAGAGQTLLKASGLVPEGPLVLAGTGPLLMLLAAQYLRAGVTITAVLDTTPPGNILAALRHLPGFLFSRYGVKGLALLVEVLRKTPIHRGVDALAAEGETRLERVVFRHRGREVVLAARQLLLHQGVVPQINLALSAGVRHRWSDTRLAFEPELGPDLETSVPGLFIAGDSAGVAGAGVAAARGMLAGLAMAARLGRAPADARALEAVARLELARAMRGRAFLDCLFRPGDPFRRPEDDVIVCRCEEVTAGTLRALARQGAQGPNQIKAFSRAGMGPCQSRQCGLTICEIMADVHQVPPDQIGLMRMRAPVKPVTVGQMAQLDGSDAGQTH